MEHAAAHGEVGRKVIVLVQRFDDETRNHRRISCDLKGISALPLHEQRAFDTNECCKRGILAMRTPWCNAGKLLFDLGSERHEPMLHSKACSA